ncbi:MAG TPA: hypothetical protein VNS63_19530 [Blastocatellia bacterium]|nr:hypothetical protein [Blastocatellia bacterium]
MASCFFLTRVVAVFLLCSLAALGQWNKKPYTEWSEKDAMKLLSDSPWAQTHSFSDTSKAFNTARAQQTQSSTVSTVITINFRVRFLSSRPVRQAISRLQMVQAKDEMPAQKAAYLKAFAEQPFPDFVVVAVTCDSDRGSDMLQQANETLRKMTTAELAGKTYLITNQGQRVYLKEYQAPRNDGFGARFIFPQLVEGKEILAPEAGEVVFHAEMGGGSELNSVVTSADTAHGYGFTLHTRYKIKDMMFGGKLEY